MTARWRSVCIVVTPGSGDGRARAVGRRLGRLLRRRGAAVTIQAFDDLPSLIQWAKTCGPEFEAICCGVAVGLVAVSRIYLDMHWLSDVIGGFALGTAYLLIAISTARTTFNRPAVAVAEPVEALPST